MNNDLIQVSYIEGKLDSKGFCSHDQLGIILVINHLYKTKPDNFGDENTRSCLKHDIDSLIADGLSHEELLGAIVDAFDDYNIAPLSNISVAVLGFDEKYSINTLDRKDYITSTIGGKKIISEFDRFIDINPSRNYGMHVECSLYHVDDKKVDYVVTGNVLNIPSSHEADMVMAGCSNILKQGGQSFHMMAYSTDNYDKVCDHSFQEFLGQKLLNTVKEPKGYIIYMQLEQEREIAFNRKHSNWFRSNLGFFDRELSKSQSFLLSNPKIIEKFDFEDIIHLEENPEFKKILRDNLTTKCVYASHNL